MSTIAGQLAGFWAALPGAQDADPHASAQTIRTLQELREQHEAIGHQIESLSRSVGVGAGEVSRLSMFHGYSAVFFVAFVVTLFATPLMRRLAVANGVIDRPNEARKVHRIPVAYLGGVALFLGIMGGIFYSYLAAKFPVLMSFHATAHVNDSGHAFPVPLSVLLGLTVIMLIGLFDDVTGIIPRVKVGGQLLAAAALAIDDVGVRVAAGLLQPLGRLFGNPQMVWHIPLPFEIPLAGTSGLEIDVIYWTGTAIIAIAVIGLCNAANLIDGLDGLLTGTTAISAIGFMVLSLTLALADDGPRDAQRIVLCLALLGACLGFLPHNFNPATIFLGDAGSMLIGFCVCVITMTLGDTGKTYIVVAGLIIFALPIIDMTLAIVRRKLNGKAISAADDQHLHHMLKRALGVKGAVFVMYAIAAAFATLGVLVSQGRARTIYVLAVVLAAFIGVTAIKIARRRHIEEQAAAFESRRASQPDRPPPGNAPAISAEAAPSPARS